MEIHDPECGCEIVSTHDWGNLSYVIQFCPLHAGAPGLLAAAKAVSHCWWGGIFEGERMAAAGKTLEAAIATAEEQV